MHLQSVNREALTYWQERGYSRAELLKVASELDDRALLMIIDFTPGSTVECTISKRVHDTQQGHITATIQFFNHLQLIHENNSLSGSVLVLLEDGIFPAHEPSTLNAPMLCFNRPTKMSTALLVPDPAFTHSSGYAQELNQIQAAEEVTPWESKRQIAFWRGALSGSYSSSATDWRKNPRCKLALYSQEHMQSEAIDAAISHLPTYIEESTKNEMLQAAIIENYVPITDFTLYRYNIDIDGEFNAWKSCFLKLATETLLFKIETHNEQWYYQRLKEWEHYVPVRSDLSDLLEKIHWAKNNDSTAKTIAENSTQLTQSLSFDSQAQETVLLLEQLLSYQSDRHQK